MSQGAILIISLILVIIFIVVATSKFKLHPFLSLIIGSYILAFAAGLPSDKIPGIITGGFGGTLTSIGIVIIAGCIIGTFLEKSGAAIKMADVVIKLVGEKRPTIAMSIIGYIVSIPVFCDSGYVILSSLNKSLAKKTKTSMLAMSIALSTGLYATHTLVPPTPGPIAAAANLKLDNLLLVIGVGMLVSIPAVIAGNWYANKISKKLSVKDEGDNEELLSYEDQMKDYGELPSAMKSFAPIVVPIILMALGSIAKFPGDPFGAGILKEICAFVGTPVNALLIGLFCAFALAPKLDEKTLTGWVGDSLKDAASILVVTAAGGALGAVIRDAEIGKYIGESLQSLNLGIFVPFIIAAALKTAQGSSTVAIVTTSALMLPLLPSLGLTSEIAKVLVVMAVGAGAMTVSHANDSYFWVVTQFGNMDVKTAYKGQTIATLIQGVVTMATVFVLSLFLI